MLRLNAQFLLSHLYPLCPSLVFVTNLHIIGVFLWRRLGTLSVQVCLSQRSPCYRPTFWICLQLIWVSCSGWIFSCRSSLSSIMRKYQGSGSQVGNNKFCSCKGGVVHSDLEEAMYPSLISLKALCIQYHPDPSEEERYQVCLLVARSECRQWILLQLIGVILIWYMQSLSSSCFLDCFIESRQKAFQSYSLPQTGQAGYSKQISFTFSPTRSPKSTITGALERKNMIYWKGM